MLKNAVEDIAVQTPEQEEINVFIAENLMGFRWFRWHPSIVVSGELVCRFLMSPSDLEVVKRRYATSWREVLQVATGHEPIDRLAMGEVQNYCGDLNAMALAEKELEKRGLMAPYLNALADATSVEGWSYRDVICASAMQRARAVVMALKATADK